MTYMLAANLKMLGEAWLSFSAYSGEWPQRLLLAGLCLLVMIAMGAWVTLLLRDEFEGIVIICIVPFMGLISILVLSLPVFLVSSIYNNTQVLGPSFGLILPGFGMMSAVAMWKLRSRFISNSKPLAALIGIMFLLILLRFPFFKDLIVPSYSDSVEHFQIISDLIRPDQSTQAFYQIDRMTVRYYHMGFHLISAFFAITLNAPVERVMLVLGQLLQVMIPLSLYLPIRSLTGSPRAGLIAILLAGMGWWMPAFGSNWGKYPALTGTALAAFMPGLLLSAMKLRDGSRRKFLILLAGLGGVAAVLSHTRILLVFFMMFSAWGLSNWALRSRFWTAAVFSITAAFTAFGFLLLPDFKTSLIFLIRPYLDKGGLPGIFVILLLVFCRKENGRSLLAAFLFGVFILAGAAIPLPHFFRQYGYQVLLDRPFSQLVFFIPLSVMGAIGADGFLNRLPYPIMAVIVQILLFVALVFNSLVIQEVAPSECCRLAGADDAAAYQWIKSTLPYSSRILIASNRTPAREFGVDGGLWITPMTGIETVMRSNQTPFSARVILDELCASGITHIYAGGNAARFHVEEIASSPWYADLFILPGAYLYRLTGCP